MRNARAARVENCERARLGPRHSSRERIDRKKRQGGRERKKGTGKEEKSRDFVRPSFRFRIVTRKNNYGKITAMFKYGSGGERSMRADNDGDVHSTLSRNAVSPLAQPPPSPYLVGKYLSLRRISEASTLKKKKEETKICKNFRVRLNNRKTSKQAERLIFCLSLFTRRSIDRSIQARFANFKKKRRKKNAR